MVSIGTLIAQQGLIKPFDSHALGERLVNAAVTPVIYLWKLVWPARLAIFYPYDADRFGIGEIVGCLAFLLGVSIVVWRLRRELPALLVGWAWYLVSLIPVVGLVQVGLQARADRYTYLPQVGVLIALVWGGWLVIGRWRQRPAVRVTVAVAVLAVALVLAARTRRQIATWSDPETLYRHALSVTEDNAWAHYNLAQILQRQEDARALTEAERHFASTLELEPRNTDALRNLGVLAERRGDLALAVDRFEQAARLDPASRFAWRDLGRAALRLGRPDQAASACERALDLGADGESSYLLGTLRIQQGRIEEAEKLLEQAVELEPEHPGVHNALGVLAGRRGDLATARRRFERAVELDPTYAEARANLDAAGGDAN
ncbi:MAG TPA: tetratricopeptide repeat protein [Thermoanaerobaculia bacterium]|nr:tetratricopeptide repeat protein [Thermoanaerobaculia bacterium]